jgi:surfactin synthase thioesterase subunit
VEAWFRTTGTPSAATPRVYCFAHAGGNPRMFLDWQLAVGPAASIVSVTMPGRGHRYAESAPPSIEEYAEGAARAIAADGAQAYLLFGHSLGALVAFEVARRLRDHTGLRHLVASGASAPILMPSARVVRAAALEGRAFAEAVGGFGGLPPEVVAAEELHDLLLPGVRADFRLVAGYRYAPAAPLPVGISLVNGVDDTHIAVERLAGWDAETTVGVQRHWAPGGHFYLQDDPGTVLRVLRDLTEGAAPATSDLLI